MRVLRTAFLPASRADKPHTLAYSAQVFLGLWAPTAHGRWLVLLSPASGGDPGGYRGPAVHRRCAQLPAGSVSWRVCLADLASEWTGSEAHPYASGDAVGPVRVDGVAPAGACYLLRGAGPSPLLEPRARDFLCIVHGLALALVDPGRRGPAEVRGRRGCFWSRQLAKLPVRLPFLTCLPSVSGVPRALLRAAHGDRGFLAVARDHRRVLGPRVRGSRRLHPRPHQPQPSSGKGDWRDFRHIGGRGVLGIRAN